MGWLRSVSRDFGRPKAIVPLVGRITPPALPESRFREFHDVVRHAVQVPQRANFGLPWAVQARWPPVVPETY